MACKHTPHVLAQATKSLAGIAGYRIRTRLCASTAATGARPLAMRWRITGGKLRTQRREAISKKSYLCTFTRVQYSALMNKTMAVKTMERQVARPLKVLVPLINQDIRDGDDAAAQAGTPYYRAAGEKLIEAKQSGKATGELTHGDFGKWAEKKFNRSWNTINEWMRLAKKTQLLPRQQFEGRSMSSFTRPNRKDRPFQNKARSVYKEILQQVKAAHPEIIERQLEEEKRSKASKAELLETRAQLGRKLAHKLIKIGYNALANEFHPDKGGNGSHEAMALLNDVASYLRKWADDYQG